jgi:hypothetical protein
VVLKYLHWCRGMNWHSLYACTCIRSRSGFFGVHSSVVSAVRIRGAVMIYLFCLMHLRRCPVIGVRHVVARGWCPSDFYGSDLIIIVYFAFSGRLNWWVGFEFMLGIAPKSARKFIHQAVHSTIISLFADKLNRPVLHSLHSYFKLLLMETQLSIFCTVSGIFRFFESISLQVIQFSHTCFLRWIINDYYLIRILELLLDLSECIFMIAL